MTAVMMCPNLTSPSNGSVMMNGTGINSVAKYSCRTGFVLRGTTKRICQNNGEWSESSPTCRGNYYLN